MPAHSN